MDAEVVENQVAGLNMLAESINQFNIKQGFWGEFGDVQGPGSGYYIESNINHDQKLMLIASEVHEAHDEIRSGHDPQEIYYGPDGEKPEGVGIELADVIIRVLDYCGAVGIDIEECIVEKLAYNITRPFKHGREF